MVPCISIICPVYKAETYIKKCIESIIVQTFKKWELLLIDDGSPDKSGDICDKYALQDKRIKVFHKMNEGVSATREFGVLKSSGEYIIHVDPDDWIDPVMLKELYDFAQKNNADMVICDFFSEYPDQTIYRCQRPVSLEPKEVLKELYTKLHGCCWNKLIKRETILKYNVHFPENISYCEDLIFITQLLQHNINIKYLNKAYYHYVQHVNSNSLVRNTNKETIIGDKRMIKEIETIIESKHILSPVIYKTYLAKGVLERTFYNKCIDNTEYKKLFQDLSPYIKYMNISTYRKFLYFISCQGYYSIAFFIKNKLSKTKKHL